MRKKILEYSITFAVCALISFIIIAVKGTFSAETPRIAYHYVTDSIFTVGVLCTALGLMILAANGGAFEMLIYGISRFISLFRKGKAKYHTFYDYQIARAERPRAEFLYFIVVGLAFIGISLIFLACYYNEPVPVD